MKAPLASARSGTYLYICPLKRGILPRICLPLISQINTSWWHTELRLIKCNVFSGTSLTGNGLTQQPPFSIRTHKHTHTLHKHTQQPCGSRYFPNGKAHCKKITVKPASVLSNYFTMSAEMRQFLFTLQWNLWPLMTDCIPPPHGTLSLLNVARQHINFTKVITSSALTRWENKTSDEESLILVVLISAGSKSVPKL